MNPDRKITYGFRPFPSECELVLAHAYAHIAEDMTKATGISCQHKRLQGCDGQWFIWLETELPVDRRVVSKVAVDTGWDIEYGWFDGYWTKKYSQNAMLYADPYNPKTKYWKDEKGQEWVYIPDNKTVSKAD